FQKGPSFASRDSHHKRHRRVRNIAPHQEVCSYARQVSAKKWGAKASPAVTGSLTASFLASAAMTDEQVSLPAPGVDHPTWWHAHRDKLSIVPYLKHVRRWPAVAMF